MNQLTVCNTSIRQDKHGRYNLNDLHAASGGDKKHQPANFLRLEQTQELIKEISNSSDLRSLKIDPVFSIVGKNGGTFTVKQLIYAYANWISPKFYLHVINTYDAMVSLPRQGNLLIESEKITEDQRKELSRVMYSKRRDHADNTPWAAFREHFGLSKVSNLPQDKYIEALEWILDLPCPHLPSTPLLTHNSDHVNLPDGKWLIRVENGRIVGKLDGFTREQEYAALGRDIASILPSLSLTTQRLSGVVNGSIDLETLKTPVLERVKQLQKERSPFGKG